MSNLSTKLIIEDVITDNHILQDAVSKYGSEIPEPILKAISILDISMRQFGDYQWVYEALKEAGEIG